MWYSFWTKTNLKFPPSSSRNFIFILNMRNNMTQLTKKNICKYRNSVYYHRKLCYNYHKTVYGFEMFSWNNECNFGIFWIGNFFSEGFMAWKADEKELIELLPLRTFLEPRLEEIVWWRYQYGKSYVWKRFGIILVPVVIGSALKRKWRDHLKLRTLPALKSLHKSTGSRPFRNPDLN